MTRRESPERYAVIATDLTGKVVAIAPTSSGITPELIADIESWGWKVNCRAARIIAPRYAADMAFIQRCERDRNEGRP